MLLLLLMCCDVTLTSFADSIADRPRDDALSHVTCPDTATERRSISWLLPSKMSVRISSRVLVKLFVFLLLRCHFSMTSAGRK